MNSKKLKILCLDDVEEDALLIRNQLGKEGLIFQFDHVSHETDFTDKLKSVKYDIILSDYNLPGFSGIAALLLAKRLCPDVPFICVSGTIGEDLAVELMHIGASDYIIKDKLSKLPVAIQRALQLEEEHKSRLGAEMSLRESEARFRDMIMSSYDWVWEIDRDWKYCYSSESIKNILGYSRSEVIGKSPFDFMPADEQKIVGPSFLKCIESKGAIKDLENWNIHKQGFRVCLLTNGFPVLDKDGNLIGYRGVDKDITDRKLAEEEIRKLSRAIEQSPVSVIITDLLGVIIYANKAVIDLTGYSRSELIGENSRIFSSGEKPVEEYKKLWDTINSGKEWKGEFHNKKKNGQLYWESVSISPILDDKGEMTHFLAVKEDITERKKLTSDLIEAKVRAEASDKLKTAFLNNISHEVRTPLNGILGFSEFIVQPDLKQEVKESYLEILNESSERLVNTISNYMDISLIVSGNMPVSSKEVDLAVLFDTIFEKFLPKCRIKKLELIKEYPLGATTYLTTDESLLEKILIHIMDNAIKFTAKGSITFGWHDIHGEYQLFVKDTGSGIDADFQSTVFQIFMQEDIASTRGYEGSGLGLSIAKGMVELLGGSIRMESVKSKGSEFYITLKRENKPESDMKSIEKSITGKNDTSKHVILVVEDDMANSAFLKLFLEINSYEYLLAYNGLEAVEMCRDHPEISLVLMDIKMPVMDGLQSTKKIREFRNGLPIIGITAYAMPGDKERALNAGFDDYITKPVRSDLLLSVLRLHLNGRKPDKTDTKLFDE